MLNISLFIHDKSKHNLFKIMSYLKLKTIPSLCVLVGQQRLISSKDQNGPSLQVCYFQAYFVQKTRLGRSCQQSPPSPCSSFHTFRIPQAIFGRENWSKWNSKKRWFTDLRFFCPARNGSLLHQLTTEG
jgi:hypothetical protein